MDLHTFSYNGHKFSVRVPRVIDNSLIGSVYKSLNHSRIVEALAGFPIDQNKDNDKFMRILRMVSDEMYNFASMVILLVRDEDKTDSDVLAKFPDMFADYEKLTDVFIDIYVNSDFTELNRKITTAINAVFAQQSSPELAPKEYLDPK